MLYLAESDPALSPSSVDGYLGGGDGTKASGGQMSIRTIVDQLLLLLLL